MTFPSMGRAARIAPQVSGASSTWSTAMNVWSPMDNLSFRVMEIDKPFERKNPSAREAD
jgi:hypothetical protein